MPIAADPTTSTTAPGEEPVISPASLTHKTSRGFAWMILQALGSKGVAAIGQVALAWMLQREDFGVVALAQTVAAFAGLPQRAGLENILIQRQRGFRRWSTAAFGLALATGLLAALLMVTAAPIAAHFYHSRQLIGLVWVLALSTPISALAIIPSARLQIDFRFREISLIGFGCTVSTTLLSILFAWLKCGAYSFVWPQLITAALRTGAYWILAKPPIPFRLDIRRWRYLLGDSGFLWGIAVCNTVMGNGDYVTLGLLQPKEVVGAYYFAFYLSTQAIATLSSNVSTALFPALSSLQQDPPRLLRAFLRATGVVSMITAPACLLQAAVAAPLLRLLFGAKWLAAIPSLEVLSIGMAMSVLGAPASTLIQAQGRFRFFFLWSVLSSIAFVIFVATGGLLGGAVSVATAVTLFYSIFGPLGLYYSIQSIGGTFNEVWRVCAIPFLAGCAAILPAYLLIQRLPYSRPTELLSIVLVSVSSVCIYVPLIRRLMPVEYAELSLHVSKLMRRVGIGRN